MAGVAVAGIAIIDFVIYNRFGCEGLIAVVVAQLALVFLYFETLLESDRKKMTERQAQHMAFAQRVGLHGDSQLLEIAYAALTPAAIDAIKNRHDLDMMLAEHAEEMRKNRWYKIAQ